MNGPFIRLGAPPLSRRDRQAASWGLAALLGAMFRGNAAYTAIAVAGFAGVPRSALLVCLLGLAGLGRGTGFAGIPGHLASAARQDQAVDISGLFNTRAWSARPLMM
jgi:hypothetical protein